MVCEVAKVSKARFGNVDLPRSPRPGSVVRMRKANALTTSGIDRIIQRNIDKLAKPGVLTVRPGHEIANHRLTGKRAIVVTVHTKRDDLPAAQQLPLRIDRVPVDVREATPMQRLRASDPAACALLSQHGRVDTPEPGWADERALPDGKLLHDPRGAMRRRQAAQADRQPALTAALSSAAKKPQVPYVSPATVTLGPITTKTTVIANVSPDAGFSTLSDFLAETRESLVIGMYDFTSGPILALFEADLVAPITLQMVLDAPSLDDTANQTDDQTVMELNSALGGRAKIVRALTRDDPHASAWMFPSAYHIKAIVRDGTSVWLSSGNLNNSNQPNLASPSTKEDRDWHIIVQDPKLAALFLAFLNQDFASASTYQQTPSAAVSEALNAAAVKLAAETTPSAPAGNAVRTRRRRGGPAKAATFAAQRFTNTTLTITPLFTPDNLASDSAQGQYITTMVALIKSAKKRLYMQQQYIEASTNSQYSELLAAIHARIEAGLDVRLIESLEYGESWAEKMLTTGIDLTSNIALQSDVHNKGFVIDSSIVVVSSQNWSPEGVRENRDAGLIIDNAAIAQYYEQVFLSDWNTRAKPFSAASSAPPPKPSKPVKKSGRRLR
jgi:hypothetical protein